MPVRRMRKAFSGTVSAVDLSNSSIQVRVAFCDGHQSSVRLWIDDDTKIMVDDRMSSLESVSKDDAVLFVRDSNFLAIAVNVASKESLARREKLLAEKRERDREPQPENKIPPRVKGKEKAKKPQEEKPPEDNNVAAGGDRPRTDLDEPKPEIHEKKPEQAPKSKEIAAPKQPAKGRVQQDRQLMPTLPEKAAPKPIAPQPARQEPESKPVVLQVPPPAAKPTETPEAKASDPRVAEPSQEPVGDESTGRIISIAIGFTVFNLFLSLMLLPNSFLRDLLCSIYRAFRAKGGKLLASAVPFGEATYEITVETRKHLRALRRLRS